ncbi:MAG: hypothetical protein HUU17_09300 [Chthonomonadales bacterium]|nr:hypothetical protein [Chthonomonadales bacterium]
MYYLSLHDMVWINAQIVSSGTPLDYEALEAGMAAQYAYGDSRDIRSQAGWMAEASLRHTAFRSGSVRTALLSVAVFLHGNGAELREDLAALSTTVREIRSGTKPGSGLIEALARTVPESPEDRYRHPPLRTTYRIVADHLAPVLAELAAEDGVVADWSVSPFLHRD